MQRLGLLAIVIGVAIFFVVTIMAFVLPYGAWLQWIMLGGVLTIVGGASLAIPCAHHHESHQTAFVAVVPAVPVSKLHDDVTRFHHVLTAIESKHALTLEENAVIDGFRFVNRRRERVRTAFVPRPSGPLARFV